MVVSQLLILGATPFIAGIYGPTALGVATTFLALASILAPVLTMRMEFLIPSASDIEARWINTYTFKVTLVGSLLAAVAFGVFIRPNEPLVALMFGLTCLAIAGSAVSIQMLIRQHKYRRIGLAKAVNGLGQVGTQVPIGLTWPGFKGIELGFAVGYIATLIAQRSQPRSDASSVSPSACRKRSLIRASLLLCVGGVTNALSVWAILLAISLFHTPEDAGVFSAIQRLLVAPAGFVTAGLLPVVTGSLGSAIRAGSSSAAALRRWFGILAPAALLSIVVFALLPDVWLVNILGPEYEGAGQYVDALALMIGTQIVAGPLGQALVAMGAGKIQFIWDVSRFAVLFIVALVSGMVGAGPVLMTWLLSGVFAFGYVIYLVLVYRVSTSSSPPKEAVT